jgi:ABC transporter transmembrane region
VFLGVLYIYSPTLMLIVAATLPLYVVLSLGVTPIFRTRLNEKFKRYAENQAFLVEAVAGVETVGRRISDGSGWSLARLPLGPLQSDRRAVTGTSRVYSSRQSTSCPKTRWCRRCGRW